MFFFRPATFRFMWSNLLQMMFFLTMVFQALEALTTLPLANTDAAWLYYTNSNIQDSECICAHTEYMGRDLFGQPNVLTEIQNRYTKMKQKKTRHLSWTIQLWFRAKQNYVQTWPNDQTLLNLSDLFGFGYRRPNHSLTYLVFFSPFPLLLQRCHSWGHCDRRRMPTAQQDCEVQRAQSDKGRWSQEAIPEILDVTLNRNSTVGKLLNKQPCLNCLSSC